MTTKAIEAAELAAFRANHHPEAEPSSTELAHLRRAISAYLKALASLSAKVEELTRVRDEANVRMEWALGQGANAEAAMTTALDRAEAAEASLAKRDRIIAEKDKALEPSGWRTMDSAPKGCPTEDAGCRGSSKWFLARPAKKYRDAGAAPMVVIKRRPWPQDDGWADNGETYYTAGYFDGWLPLPAPIGGS